MLFASIAVSLMQLSGHRGAYTQTDLAEVALDTASVRFVLL